ncbi:MAG: helix-turn-helix domain-containing protein [Fibrobacteria bacterium]|nr:helix-turn-helix domain-containing protein [Fibrobacteria bacterium]
MQHDTSPYTIKIGDRKVSVHCSGLYLRYSKMRYIKFYRRFNRFSMKCFMEEALRFWNYSAQVCIIDNTNLAIHYGTGPRAVMVQEMINFAKNYGFVWKAHEVRHSNRKAGTERNFWTVETNFFPGRTFTSLEDLNEQALLWATQRYAKRPQSKSGLIPIETFEHEKPYLTQLSEYISPVYKDHERRLDVYGYASFMGNYYWVPEYGRDNEKIKTVKILEYAEHFVMYYRGREMAKYSRPKEGVKNERFAPLGVNLHHKPRNRKKSCKAEETVLRSLGPDVCEYVDFVKSKESGIHRKYEFIRQFYHFTLKLAPQLLEKTIERALTYRVTKIETLSNIAVRLMKRNGNTSSEFLVQHDYMEREAYQKGRFCNEQGFDKLNSLFNRDKEPEEP